MPTLNLQGSGRQPVIFDSVYQYWPYPTATDAGRARLDKVQRAIAILDRYVASGASTTTCDPHFLGLAGGRSFRTVWADPAVILSYNPRGGNIYGHAEESGQDLALTQWCLETQNRYMVAATIVHEMAHINGADGIEHDAERSVRQCGLRELYLPGVFGNLNMPSFAKALQAYG